MKKLLIPIASLVAYLILLFVSTYDPLYYKLVSQHRVEFFIRPLSTMFLLILSLSIYDLLKEQLSK